MYYVTKEFKWDMAHRLPTHEWKCWNVHWHTYRAMISLMGEEVQEKWPETGMLKDFWNLKPIKDWIDENWDHAYVWSRDDKVVEFLKGEWFRTYMMENNPTAENMARLLYEKVAEFFPDIWINKVVVYETPTSFAEYWTNDDLPF